MERLTNKNWQNLDPWECCGQDNYCQRDCHGSGGCTNGCIVPKIYRRLAEFEDLAEAQNTEYIKRDAVIDLLHYNADEACSSIIADVEAISAADVAPVWHARWIPEENGDVYFSCSYCGCEISTDWDYDDLWQRLWAKRWTQMVLTSKAHIWFPGVASREIICTKMGTGSTTVA